MEFKPQLMQIIKDLAGNDISRLKCSIVPECTIIHFLEKFKLAHLN